MYIEESQTYQHQKRTHRIKFTGWVEAGIEIRKTQDAHSTPSEKDESDY